MSHIKTLLINKFVDKLTEDLIDNIPPSDPSRASLVKAYRFQQNPLNDNIHVYVTPNDPDNPEDRDARVSARDMENLKMRIPIAEVGGGHLWWRKFKAGIGCYFVRQRFSEQDAAEYAHIVMGRVMDSLESVNLTGVSDEFGEKAILVVVYASTLFEGGGPPQQYLWRGDVQFQVLTERIK